MEEIELQPLNQITQFKASFGFPWKYILGFICVFILIFLFSYNTYVNHSTRDLTYKEDDSID